MAARRSTQRSPCALHRQKDPSPAHVRKTAHGTRGKGAAGSGGRLPSASPVRGAREDEVCGGDLQVDRRAEAISQIVRLTQDRRSTARRTTVERQTAKTETAGRRIASPDGS